MMDATHKIRKFKHFTLEDRQMIYHMRFREDKNLSDIALTLGKSKSSISMELKRNKVNGKYVPELSNSKYKSRLHMSDGYKIDRDRAIYDYIVTRLKYDKWSPDVISAIMYQDIGLSVSAESIYNYIHNSPTSKSLELYKLLPSQNPLRIKHGSRRKKSSIPGRVSVHEREDIANDKKELGHLEGDLTFHKGNQSKNIGVLVDKKSQKVFLVANNSKRKNTVACNFANRIKSIPPHLRKTLTFDNGKEFTSHMTYRLQGFKTYFCDAHYPWQKGLVEKINSMIHRIFPKKMDINLLTKKMLIKIENILNNMPRKILGYKTPNQIWKENM